MTPSLFEFQFTPSIEATEAELQSLWDRTVLAQKAMDSFLAGEITGWELTDHFDIYEIDSQQAEQALEENLIILGVS